MSQAATIVCRHATAQSTHDIENTRNKLKKHTKYRYVDSPYQIPVVLGLSSFGIEMAAGVRRIPWLSSSHTPITSPYIPELPSKGSTHTPFVSRKNMRPCQSAMQNQHEQPSHNFQ